MRQLNWALPLASGVALAVLVLVVTPQLAAQSAGGMPFDLRPFGYSLAEAQAYLAALTMAGARLYLGAFRLTDTLLPLLLTPTLCLPLRGRGQVWFLPALVYGLLDLWENLAIARLIHLGPDVDAAAVAWASSLTQAKFAALAVAVLLALHGAWTAWRAR